MFVGEVGGDLSVAFVWHLLKKQAGMEWATRLWRDHICLIFKTELKKKKKKARESWKPIIIGVEKWLLCVEQGSGTEAGQFAFCSLPSGCPFC